MKSISTLALATALSLPLAFTLPAAAQTTAPAAAVSMSGMNHAGGMSHSAEMAEGEIRKVSKDTGKLTIKHGPIKSMDMPPMTMVFTAKDPAMLDKVAVGDKVRFAVADEGGKMLVTDIQLAK
ncbi:copper-binding protein [Hydrogenophaga sp.]|uniref:copper-binding protein n=1 Tax=Hydrogenophaga sp. TaxID=1904254 RepID=UPI0025BCCACC|nr:copper-binding protein [Hydrogenophaga sp.]